MSEKQLHSVPAYPHANDGSDSFDVVSASDYTGMIAAQPKDEGEADAYSDLTNIPKSEDFKDSGGA